MSFGSIAARMLAACVTVVASVTPARAQPPATARASGLILQAHRVADLTVDGRLDEAIYRDTAPFDQFVEQEPQEGAPVTEKTEVWVLFDERNVYVSARMWDSHPERMIANEMRRDGSDIFNNENFSVAFDTFNDQRTAVYFMTNILGAMRDAQVVSGGPLNGDWNPIWNPKAQRFDQGWTLELAVPFKSIRYPSVGEQTWGIQMRRVVRWKNEISHLTRIPAAIGGNGITRPAFAATLTGMVTPAAGHNLELKPYAISRDVTDRLSVPARRHDLDAAFGGEVKYGVTKGLTLDLTYNTDFAQVEDDLQQVNLTRFGLFFPEKREFFLEGQGIFSFGGVGGGSTAGGDVPFMFFSRNIGLFAGQPVPIVGGGRLTGKAGKFSIGLMDVQTSASSRLSAPSTNFGVVRVRRDILRKSAIGLIATQRTPSTGHNNAAFGVDANFESGLTLINTYWAKTVTDGRSGKDQSYYASYDYNADRYGLSGSTLGAGANFNPEMGFQRRSNFRWQSLSGRFSPRPVKRWKAVRKFYYTGSFDYYTDNNNVLQSRLAGAGFRIERQNQDQYSVTVTDNLEALVAPFRVATGVTIPVGSYDFRNVNLSYQPSVRHKVRGTFQYNTGSFYDGNRQLFSYSGRIDLTPQLGVEPSVSLNFVKLPYGDFTSHVVSTRTTYTLNPRSFVAALVQFNSSTRTVSSNVRFRWEYIPGSDLFFVYNEGRTTDPLEPDRLTALQNRTFVIKVTRMLRY